MIGECVCCLSSCRYALQGAIFDCLSSCCCNGVKQCFSYFLGVVLAFLPLLLSGFKQFMYYVKLCCSVVSCLLVFTSIISLLSEERVSFWCAICSIVSAFLCLILIHFICCMVSYGRLIYCSNILFCCTILLKNACLLLSKILFCLGISCNKSS